MPKSLAPWITPGKNQITGVNGSADVLAGRGSGVIGIGNLALSATTNNTTTTTGLIAIGENALRTNNHNTSVGGVIAIGHSAMQSATTVAVRCLAIGFEALKVANSADSVAIGHQAGKLMAGGGGRNTVIGSLGGAAFTTGTENVAIGYGTAGLATGSGNVQVGMGAVGAGATSYGTGVGYNVVLNGDYCICVGLNAQAVKWAMAIGTNASATALGSVAIGTDNAGTAVTTAVVNEFKLGTALHRYNLPGQLNAPLNAGAQKITNLATPTVATDAATMAYVDSKASTPIVPNTGWSVTAGYTVDKGFNPESTTVTELARVVGTLVDALKAQNILGS